MADPIYYKSAYTGKQIDQAIGKMLDTDIAALADQATAAAVKAEAAAQSIPEFPEITESSEGKVLGIVDGKYAFIEAGTGGTVPTYTGTVEVS